MDKLSNNDLSMIRILCNKKYDNTTMKKILQSSAHKKKYRPPSSIVKFLPATIHNEIIIDQYMDVCRS